MDLAEGNLVFPLQAASTTVDFTTGVLSGSGVESVQCLGDLHGVFADEAARARMPQDAVVYTVQVHKAEREGMPGGLCFGTSFLHPGVVSEEFYMTRGHFHGRLESAEYYWGLQGEGILLLMDRNRRCTAERVIPGSLHYIPGHTAHRLINTGSTILAVGACWPADAGHDYDTIARQGFSARILRRDGKPVAVAQGEA